MQGINLPVGRFDDRNHVSMLMFNCQLADISFRLNSMFYSARMNIENMVAVISMSVVSLIAMLRFVIPVVSDRGCCIRFETPVIQDRAADGGVPLVHDAH